MTECPQVGWTRILLPADNLPETLPQSHRSAQ